jgi:hypothetical protein
VRFKAVSFKAVSFKAVRRPMHCLLHLLADVALQ